MKRTLTINLNANVFHIDEDAYDLLKKYIELIESRFSDKQERKEVMSDIEARIAELFKAGSKEQNLVITLADVEKVITIMGEPEEIAGDEFSSGQSRGQARRTRKLYRNVDNRIFGGVASGLAAFFDVDVTLMRVIAVILIFAMGSGLFLYLLLWIFVPAAVTTAQKLEMKGEPVNIRNIGKAVRDEFEQVRKNMNI
jgi:phage shock protein PspC (stress-responsive transcriptional regulator)